MTNNQDYIVWGRWIVEMNLVFTSQYICRRQ